MSKSVAWDYFKLDNEKINVRCGLCRDVMTHNKLSTSNMIRHLRLKHSDVYVGKKKNNTANENNIDDPRVEVAENPLVSKSVSTFTVWNIIIYLIKIYFDLLVDF